MMPGRPGCARAQGRVNLWCGQGLVPGSVLRKSHTTTPQSCGQVTPGDCLEVPQGRIRIVPAVYWVGEYSTSSEQDNSDFASW